jgi:hypothetical protein
MPRARRLLTAGLAAAAVHEGLALLALLVLGSGQLAWWLGLSGLLLAVVAVVAVRLIERPFPDPPGGGTEAAPPDDPPPWWPEFERAFRDHVARAQHRDPV